MLINILSPIHKKKRERKRKKCLFAIFLLKKNHEELGMVRSAFREAEQAELWVPGQPSSHYTDSSQSSNK